MGGKRFLRAARQRWRRGASPRAGLGAALGVTLLTLSLASLLGATAAPATAQPHGRSPAPAANSAVPPAAPASARPAWSELDAVQKRILAPLETDWASMTEVHRRKWLQIARRYQTMTPAEQARLDQRMSEWARLSPDQRRAARENYLITRSLPADRKAQAWDRYQQLPDDRKQELAEAEKVPPRPGAVSALPSKKQPTQTHPQGTSKRSAPASASAPAAPASSPAAPPASTTAGPVLAASNPAASPAGAASEAAVEPPRDIAPDASSVAAETPAAQ